MKVFCHQCQMWDERRQRKCRTADAGHIQSVLSIDGTALENLMAHNSVSLISLYICVL